MTDWEFLYPTQYLYANTSGSWRKGTKVVWCLFRNNYIIDKQKLWMLCHKAYVYICLAAIRKCTKSFQKTQNNPLYGAEYSVSLRHCQLLKPQTLKWSSLRQLCNYKMNRLRGKRKFGGKYMYHLQQRYKILHFPTDCIYVLLTVVILTQVIYLNSVSRFIFVMDTILFASEAGSALLCIMWINVRLQRSVPALVNAGPDCGPRGRPLKVIVQSKESTDVLVY
jgi:hypothetical protein